MTESRPGGTRERSSVETNAGKGRSRPASRTTRDLLSEEEGAIGPMDTRVSIEREPERAGRRSRRWRIGSRAGLVAVGLVLAVASTAGAAGAGVERSRSIGSGADDAVQEERAQEQEPMAEAEMGVEDMFWKARELAFDGKRSRSRELAREILERNPDYHDARVLLARVLAWDRNYDEARRHLHVVLEARPGYTDARNALVDVETWSDRYEEAVAQADQGLQHEPGHEDLLYKKARALEKLGRDQQAVEVAERLMAVNPEHEKGRKLLEQASSSPPPTEQEAGYYRVREDTTRWKLGADYEFVDFSTFDDPWQQVSMELSGRAERLSVIGRVNFANRFAENTVQYEVDAYPKFGHGVYAYLNFGYSPDRFFPETRYGAELYTSLPKSFEASFGFRQLNFDSSDVTIYTGSVGKYWGNYWLSVRPYITPKDEGTSTSLQVWLRRYFGTRYDYITFRVGAGAKPDDNLTTIDLGRRQSFSVAFDGKKPIGRGLLLTWDVGYDREELAFDRIRNRFDFGIGFEKLF